MSAYEEIDPSQIREGDLIRWEVEHASKGRFRGVEYIAGDDEDAYLGDGTHYLISRPKPPVVIPGTPTLGWLSYDANGERGWALGRWYQFNSRFVLNDTPESFLHENVVGFEEAVAVPKATLDEFRAAHKAAIHMAGDWRAHNTARRVANETFLAAIDSRGGGEG